MQLDCQSIIHANSRMNDLYIIYKEAYCNCNDEITNTAVTARCSHEFYPLPLSHDSQLQHFQVHMHLLLFTTLDTPLETITSSPLTESQNCCCYPLKSFSFQDPFSFFSGLISTLNSQVTKCENYISMNLISAGGLRQFNLPHSASSIFSQRINSFPYQVWKMSRRLV